MRARFIVMLLALLACPLSATAEDRMTPELLWKLGRVGGGSVSKDGKKVAYTVRRYDLAKNAGRSEIHVLTLEGKKDETVATFRSASDLQWGKGEGADKLFFVGTPTEKKDAKPQVWSLEPGQKTPRQITKVKEGVANLKVSPTGTHLAFTIDVKMDATVKELYKDLPKADARIIDSLMYRHWNAWHDYAYSHLHVAKLKDDSIEKPVDLMKGLRFDCPLPPFGGSEHFAWSPDGTEIAYTAKMVNNPAESTDSGIYLVSIKGGRARCITPGREGYDTTPVYSPDGKLLAFHSMERASFESDRNRIMIYDRASEKTREITKDLDQTAHSATWLPDSKSVIFMSEYRGTNQLFQVSADGGKPKQITKGRYNFSLHDVLPDGKTAIVGVQSMIRPYEIATLDLGTKKLDVVTTINDEHYKNLKVPTIKERWVRASDGKKIHNWVIYPPDFDPNKKWPLLVYCQGGPQGQIGQWFSFRWNFHLMASQGYVVIAVNRRGLPGFGRAWNDQISGDWGGQAMKDILAATDDMVTEPYVDAKRVGAVGASFGGYTVYWMMGNHKDRFCTMISHCGVFNLESMYGSTEELFFPNWDLGGPYWKNSKVKQDYDRFSPHRFVRNWKTPLLVIHGQKDFRVPVTQGMEAFTAAKVQGAPARFLYFPNEGHWVMSPQNGVLWHRVFFDWLGRYCKPEK